VIHHTQDLHIKMGRFHPGGCFRYHLEGCIGFGQRLRLWRSQIRSTHALYMLAGGAELPKLVQMTMLVRGTASCADIYEYRRYTRGHSGTFGADGTLKSQCKENIFVSLLCRWEGAQEDTMTCHSRLLGQLTSNCNLARALVLSEEGIGAGCPFHVEALCVSAMS